MQWGLAVSLSDKWLCLAAANVTFKLQTTPQNQCGSWLCCRAALKKYDIGLYEFRAGVGSDVWQRIFVPMECRGPQGYYWTEGPNNLTMKRVYKANGSSEITTVQTCT